MIVYRLCKRKYAKQLSGIGAERYGGRWNSRGTPMLYTSESMALCAVEIAVHTPLGNIPLDYVLMTIEIPDDCIKQMNVASLPKDWKKSPHGHQTQRLGDEFIGDGVHLTLKVPAAVIQGEFNLLINPHHPRFSEVCILKTEPFEFDQRMFK